MTPEGMIAIALAYLLGAIPVGLIIGKMVAGVDLRHHGSKNIGFTNAYRVLGWKPALPVLLLDIGKGLAAVLALPMIAGGDATPTLAVYCGLGAVAGNIFNAFLGFKGGKGVATGLGVFLGLAPIPTLLAFAAFMICMFITRYVSLGSLLALPVLVGGIFWQTGISALFWMGVTVAVIVVVKHRGNIVRLVNGNERRFGEKDSEQSVPAESSPASSSE